jgi:hypothetical protein
LRQAARVSRGAVAATVERPAAAALFFNIHFWRTKQMLARQLVGGNGYAPIVGAAFNTPNASGATNTPVSTAVSFTDAFGNGTLPQGGNYCVVVTPSQACFVSVSAKTVSGFNVTLTPTSSSTAIAAGSFDCLVHS